MTRSTLLATPDEPDPGKDPREFRLLRVGDLVIDPSAQREAKEPRWQRIAECFDWALFEVITVVERPNGTYAVIEGQNRTLAARLLFGPDALVMCAVMQDVSIAREAEIALQINDARRKMSPYERWRQDVRRGHPRPVAAEAVLAEFGVRLAPTKATSTSIRAVALVAQISGSGRTAETGAEALRRVLYVLDTAYPINDELNAERRFYDELLRAVWDIVKRNPKVDLDVLAATIRGQVAEQWCTLASPAEPAYRVIVGRIVRLYNKRSRRPGWRIEP